MVRASVLVMMAGLSHAPLQCTGDPEPGMEREERPGEALYELAQEFKRDGDEDAWRKTLEHLVRRHPASRFAVTAKADLEAAGVGSDEGAEGDGPSEPSD